MKSSFEELLARDGYIVYTSIGTSMLPFIRPERDLLVIESPNGRLRRMDVALYRRSNGRYVLHRVLLVRKRDYLFCGDNQWQIETGVTDSEIIGVLKTVVRDGRELYMTDLRYRLCVHIWCDLYPLRALGVYVIHAIMCLVRKF